MVKKKIRLERIPDEKLQQAAFIKRKNALLRKAMELSVLCECDVAVIIFGTGSDKLVQYSSTDMENILERYSTACQQPHERRTNDELFKQYYTDGNGKGDDENGCDVDDDGKADDRGRKRPRSLEDLTRKILRPGSPALSDGSVSSMSEGSLLGTGAADVLKPLGLAIDRRIFPVSPKSERAFESITVEFDKMLEQMRQVQEQVAAGGQQALHGRINGTTRPTMPGASSPLIEAATSLPQQPSEEEATPPPETSLLPMSHLPSTLPALETTNYAPLMQMDQQQAMEAGRSAPLLQPQMPPGNQPTATELQPMNAGTAAGSVQPPTVLATTNLQHLSSLSAPNNTSLQPSGVPALLNISLQPSSMPAPKPSLPASDVPNITLPSSSAPASNISLPASAMPPPNTSLPSRIMSPLNMSLPASTLPVPSISLQFPRITAPSAMRPSRSVPALDLSLPSRTGPAPSLSLPSMSAPAHIVQLLPMQHPASHTRQQPAILSSPAAPGLGLSLPSVSLPAHAAPAGPPATSPSQVPLPLGGATSRGAPTADNTAAVTAGINPPIRLVGSRDVVMSEAEPLQPPANE